MFIFAHVDLIVWYGVFSATGFLNRALLSGLSFLFCFYFSKNLLPSVHSSVRSLSLSVLFCRDLITNDKLILPLQKKLLFRRDSQPLDDDSTGGDFRVLITIDT